MSDTHYVLDAEDRVVRVVGSMRRILQPFLGHSIWEASPGARPLFSEHFERARATGTEVEFVAFYSGRLARRRVVPSGDTLTVFVTVLRELDVRTLGRLVASLRAIEDELADRGSARPGPRAPGSLQALP